MAAEIRFEFVFEGDPWDKPEELSTILGVKATEVGHKGSDIPGKDARKFRYTFWMHQGDSVIDADLNTLTDAFLSVFEPKTQLIEEYMAAHPHLSVGLCVLIYAAWNDFQSLYFDVKFVAFLGRIHASIGCDIYLRNSV
jgi:hypothetical protein